MDHGRARGQAEHRRAGRRRRSAAGGGRPRAASRRAAAARSPWDAFTSLVAFAVSWRADSQADLRLVGLLALVATALELPTRPLVHAPRAGRRAEHLLYPPHALALRGAALLDACISCSPARCSRSSAGATASAGRGRGLVVAAAPARELASRPAPAPPPCSARASPRT